MQVQGQAKPACAAMVVTRSCEDIEAGDSNPDQSL